MTSHWPAPSRTWWLATAVSATRTMAGKAAASAVASLPDRADAGLSGVMRSCRVQPMARSWAIRGPVTENTAHIAP